MEGVSFHTNTLSFPTLTPCHFPHLQYVSQLRGMTKGRAQYSMKLERYEVVPPNIQTEIGAV